MKHSRLSVSVLTRLVVLTVLGGRLLAVPLAQAAPAFTLFESGQVRPLAMSPDRRNLFAVNTPDNRLEVSAVSNQGLAHLASVPSGLEPVAVAARDEQRSLGRQPPLGQREHRRASTGEPTAHVDAHAARRRRAARHRVRRTRAQARRSSRPRTAGRTSRSIPQLTTPGVGRADVWVFDANNLGTTLGGTPLTIVNLFSDTPRALAVTPDGSRVYAAGFTPATRPPSSPSAVDPRRRRGRTAASRGPTSTIAGVPAPEVGPHRQVQRRSTGSTSSAGPGTTM